MADSAVETSRSVVRTQARMPADAKWPHWPARRPGTSPRDSEEQQREAEPVERIDAPGTKGEKPRQVVKIDWIKIRDLGRV